MQTTVTLPTQGARAITATVSRLRNFLTGIASVSLVTLLILGYRATLTPVTLIVDGQERRVRTHQDTVAALLLDTGVAWDSLTRVEPAPQTPLRPGQIIVVQHPRPVLVCADGHTLLLRTHARSVEGILREARVSLGPYDELEVEGTLAANGSNPDAGESKTARLIVRRAVPIEISENGQTRVAYTTAATVGEALYRLGYILYRADRVTPGLGERVVNGLRITLKRSTPVTVEVDGRLLRTRTHRERVDEVLADLGIVLTGEDYTTPTLESVLPAEGATIRVIRVSERFLIEEEPIPFEVMWQPDPELEIDHQRLLQEGAPGTLRRRVRVRYEDGLEVGRVVEGEYVAVPPTAKVWGYGTKIVIRTLETPEGPVEYWRVIRMLATSYSASTAGTPPTSPWYGRTATGMQMRHGIVAVDPRVIPLRSRVYVPGYGIGIAGDTGGAIKGRRIDLGYDDDNLVLWYRWVDVYLLTPVPPNIDYTLGLTY